MTNFLTRLLERTQGTFPSSQLAQPLLNSTFIPRLMSLEPSIEMHEERDANPVTSFFIAQPEQERSREKPQTAPYLSSQPASQAELSIVHPVERQTVEPFEIPALNEKTPNKQPASLQQFHDQLSMEQSEQDEAHQETTRESVEEKGEGLTNQHISYRNIAITSQSLPPSRSSLDLQLDFMQTSQSNVFAEKPEISLASETVTDAEELKGDLLEEQELLVETRQPDLLVEQQAMLSTSSHRDVHGDSEEFKGIEEFEESTLAEHEVDGGITKEHLQSLEREQQVNELLLPRQTVSQDGARVPAQRGNEQEVNTTARHKPETLESQEELLVMPSSSAHLLNTSTLHASSAPLIEEQEYSQRVEATHTSQKHIARETVQRADTVRVEREIFLEAQASFAEQVQQEQARQNEVYSQRRIIPTQGHVTRQAQSTGFSTNESMTPPLTPVVPPTIQVSIGRIEVRAIASSTPAPRQKAVRPSPSLSLEDYLKQQKGGR